MLSYALVRRAPGFLPYTSAVHPVYAIGDRETVQIQSFICNGLTGGMGA